jgi:multidrug resistance efflux pump
MKTLTIRILLAVLVLGGATYLAIQFNRPAAAKAAPAPRPITQPAADLAVANDIKAIGSFMSANQATLAFLMAGRVQEIKVKEGDKVHVGDVIASLDTSMLDLQVAQAQAALDAANAALDKVKTGPTVQDVTIAKSNLDRAKAALDQAQAAYDRIGGASNPLIEMTPQSLALQQASSAYQAAVAAYSQAVDHPTSTELRTAQAQAAQAQAALDLARQNVTNARIKAPFDGSVVWVGPHVGESVSPGAPAVSIADLSHMQVQAGVDENALATIQLGQSATITADALPGQALTGHVSKIGFLAATTAGIVSVPVTIDVDASQTPIDPGLSATVQIHVENK